MSNSSAAVRVFRGCRTLFAPAKSATTAAPTAKPSKASAPAASAVPKAKSKSKQKPAAAKDVPSRPSGIQKVTPVSPALAQFLKSPESSRVDALKRIWSHIKLHNLQNPTDKREILCDDKLKSIFDGKEKVGFLEIVKLLSRHFVKTA